MTDTVQRGAVAAGDPQTARAGAEVLARGGNAVDAAVAAAFAAFMCELPLAGPLGGGVMLIDDGAVRSFDFFARMPGSDGARPADLDFKDVEVDFGATTQCFHIGRGAAAMGGALRGLIDVHRRHGRIPLTEVAQPAVELGRAGYRLSAPVAYVFELLTPILTLTDATRRLHCPDDDDRLGRAGDVLRNRDLSTVLEDVARQPEALHAIDAQLMREFGRNSGGLLTAADAASWETVEAPALGVSVGTARLLTMPPPSTGGVLIALGVLLGTALGDHPFLSPGHVGALLDVMRRLVTARTDDFDVRVRSAEFLSRMLSPEGVAELANVPLTEPVEAANQLGSTTHISVATSAGTTASLTMTNGEGCGHTLAGTGIHVNNLLGEEDINPRGFHQEAPGTRLSTMMAPSILSYGGARCALGSGGSNRLRNAILGVVTHLLCHRQGLASAVLAPRLHLESAQEGIFAAYEDVDWPTDIAAVVGRCGSVARFADRSMYFGGVHAAETASGTVSGAGDPRRGGAVAICGRSGIDVVSALDSSRVRD